MLNLGRDLEVEAGKIRAALPVGISFTKVMTRP
jgi:hypothetical protein